MIEKKYMSKLDKYFNNFFMPSNEGTEVELIALSDEEESANVLKLLKDRITVLISTHNFSIERFHCPPR